MLAQVALGEGASLAQRLVALLAQCPTLHKLGQMLARNRHLPAELRGQLQTLETMPSSLPVEAIAEQIRSELGDRLDAGDQLVLADAPLAEASVAVVLPFEWREDGASRHGVFKILKPGVERRLADELAALPALAGFLRRRGGELGLPSIDYDDYLGSVRRLLEREIRLDNEQANLRRAAEFYADDPRVQVPRLLRWSTPRITAMERVFGKPATEAGLAPWQQRRLAETMVSALLAAPFFSAAEQAVFHGDLHGGNLFAADDGRLAVLDWGLTAGVSKVQRELLVEMALGAFSLDAAALRRALASLVGFEPDEPLVAATVERALDRLVAQGRPPGFDWLLGLLDEFALASPRPLPAELALLRKTWLSLSGVIGDLAPELSPDFPLFDVGLRRFFAELPARMLAPPTSRAFATHLSNADLAAAGSGWGIVWLRWWTRLASLATRRAGHAARPGADASAANFVQAKAADGD
ncbi:MAG: AarF/ABC1/UbiB kinase family protein [Limnobacter sp.]|nr:AarF/ABC1/UbiB kinase family protein [Limnobacter sp.]